MFTPGERAMRISIRARGRTELLLAVVQLNRCTRAREGYGKARQKVSSLQKRKKEKVIMFLRII